MAKIGCHVMWCPNGPQDYGTDRQRTLDTYKSHGAERVNTDFVALSQSRGQKTVVRL